MVKVVKPPRNDKLPLTRPVIGVAGKTGLWRNMKPLVNTVKCTRCYQCEIYCPVNAINVEPESGAMINYDYCKGCGLCVDVCPSGAITMIPETGE